MQIERLFSDKTIPYVPQFAGERERVREDPDFSPVVFHLQPMTVAQFEASGEILQPSGGEGPLRFQVRPEQEDEILSTHVRRIENLAYSDGTSIPDGRAFAEARQKTSGTLAPLFLEILAAVRDLSILREGERKN